VVKFKIDTGQEIEIVEVEVSDAEGILQHAQEIVANDDFNVSIPEELEITVQQEREWIRQHIDDAGKMIFVAKVDGKVVGLATVENRPRKRIEHVGSVSVSVDSKYRRNGIGAALIEAVVNWAKAEPVIEKLGLSVFADNHLALRLYEKMGFAEEGRRVKEIKRGAGSYVDDIMMYRMLKDI
jgi:RimJ/RimL family protein N-acetyltransferase